ncbi:MAG: aminomethyl-transferring glycine dehydrogenase subunit GcvPB [Promethearchaeota archaeon]
MERKQAQWNEPIIFEIGHEGRRGVTFPDLGDLKAYKDAGLKKIRKTLRKTPPALPDISELQVSRHYTRLSEQNYSIVTGFYPLGSCTMKFNPPINNQIAGLEAFTELQPYMPKEAYQHALKIIYTLERWLGELVGLPEVSLQPAAGAQGEFTGILVLRAYHKSRGELEQRTEIIVPDSAHGTNPASAAMAGFKVVIVPSDSEGCIDLEALKTVVGSQTAGLMLTNPNTLGVFEKNVEEVTTLVHNAGGLVYYDGANLNAIMGWARPGDMGFDIAHLNLHKTFSTPHGGGGPGAGAVCVREDLGEFLPIPIVKKEGSKYYFDNDRPESIGKVHGYYGNFGILVRAYAYIYSMGFEGLKRASAEAVLHANYIASQLKDVEGLSLPYTSNQGLVKHECVLSAKDMKKKFGVTTLDVSKRLLDSLIHPPTVYFPLIVPEALMIEPTETEPKEALDEFIETIKNISREAKENAELVLKAPFNTAVGRIDDVRAVRQPALSYRMKQKKGL